MAPALRDSRDALFVRFVLGLLVVLALYGLGMFLAVIWGDTALASRLVSGFGTMFAGILGLGSGYLLGQRTNGAATKAE